MKSIHSARFYSNSDNNTDEIDESSFTLPSEQLLKLEFPRSNKGSYSVCIYVATHM